MEMNDYQRLAQRTSSTIGYSDKIINGVMGLNGESGECIDMVKKWQYQGHTLDIDELEKELGDVLWYIAECATGIDRDLSDIAEKNVEKLRRRYPDGFSANNSVYRDE